ncbi:MAG: DUF2905 domain-containing protein [Thermodesulfobacteriota bacterium]
MDYSILSRFLILFGLLMVLLGLLIFFSNEFGFLGKLPGDIFIKTANFNIYIPITSSIILSIVLTALINLIFGEK